MLYVWVRSSFEPVREESYAYEYRAADAGEYIAFHAPDATHKESGCDDDQQKQHHGERKINLVSGAGVRYMSYGGSGYGGFFAESFDDFDDGARVASTLLQDRSFGHVVIFYVGASSTLSDEFFGFGSGQILYFYAVEFPEVFFIRFFNFAQGSYDDVFAVEFVD